MFSSLYNPLATFCSCAVRFVSDVVGKPEDSFGHDATHFIEYKHKWYLMKKNAGGYIHTEEKPYTDPKYMHHKDTDQPQRSIGSILGASDTEIDSYVPRLTCSLRFWV